MSSKRVRGDKWGERRIESTYNVGYQVSGAAPRVGLP